jgi:hypothetical protein
MTSVASWISMFHFFTLIFRMHIPVLLLLLLLLLPYLTGAKLVSDMVENPGYAGAVM